MGRTFFAVGFLTFALVASGADAPLKINWQKEINVTAGGEAGNNENYNYNVSGDLQFTSSRWRGELIDLRIKESVIRREGDDQERRRDHSIYYDGDLKRSLGKGKYGIAATWEWNDARDEDDSWNRYWNVGLGWNAQIYQGKKLNFEIDSIGVTFQTDYPRGLPSYDDVWAKYVHTLNWKFNDSTSLEWESTLKLNPNDEASQQNRWKANQELTLRTALSKTFNFVVDGVWLWDSAPLAEDDENVDGYDVSLSMGVGARW